ncbi:MAG TPA: class D sortase [Vicinamibacterales bacterium]|jgi:LPXTG-site transpeptidase (sortase) family protein|nr:class D sortase [Vicinamibacterales bacterium]
MTIHRARALRALEVALLALGLALGGWCATVLIEAAYVNRLPLASGAQLEKRAGGFSSAQRGRTIEDWQPPTPANGTVVARFDAPTVRLSANVLEGSTDDVLAKAAGHIEGTARPGEAGNVGIAGHRDTTFRAVRNLKIGDPILLKTTKGVFDYRIVSTQIVTPDAVWVLDPTDRPVLTLVTCYPFNFIGHAPKRYIVKANLVGTR